MTRTDPGIQILHFRVHAFNSWIKFVIDPVVMNGKMETIFLYFPVDIGKQFMFRNTNDQGIGPPVLQ